VAPGSLGQRVIKGPNGKPIVIRTGRSARPLPRGEVHKEVHNERLGNSKPMAFLFWLFALMCVGGYLFVITRANLIAAVMGMVGTFFAVAAVFAMLYAHFLAAIQVLVYAGAIMVLFVFVIMILNRPEDEVVSRKGGVGKALAVLASLYLLWRIGAVLWDVKPPNPVAGLSPGDQVGTDFVTSKLGGIEYVAKVDFGSTDAVGETLFTKYLFPFEAVSLVLLIAVVGAIAVARPHVDREPDEDEAGTEVAAAE
jgi:NADH-quinone oxidoreductase subunit J